MAAYRRCRRPAMTASGFATGYSTPVCVVPAEVGVRERSCSTTKARRGGRRPIWTRGSTASSASCRAAQPVRTAGRQRAFRSARVYLPSECFAIDPCARSTVVRVESRRERRLFCSFRSHRLISLARPGALIVATRAWHTPLLRRGACSPARSRPTRFFSPLAAAISGDGSSATYRGCSRSIA